MELIENDLDTLERADLDARLHRIIAQAQFPEHARLAEALLAVHQFGYPTGRSIPIRIFMQRSLLSLRDLQARWLTQRRLELVVIAGLLLAGAGSLLELLIAGAALIIPDLLTELIASTLLSEKLVTNPLSFSWFLILLILSGITGGMMMIGGALIFLKRAQLGSEFGYLGLIVALTMVNLLLVLFQPVCRRQHDYSANSPAACAAALSSILSGHRRKHRGARSADGQVRRTA